MSGAAEQPAGRVDGSGTAVPTITIRRTDGLGGRLLALVRVLRFAEKLGARVTMRWASLAYTFRDHGATDWTPSELFDLDRFDFDGLDLAEGTPEPLDPGTLVLEERPDLAQHLRFGFDPETLLAHGASFASNGQRLLRLVGETDADVHEGLVTVFDRLIPKQAVRDEFAATKEILGPQPFVALHVRRGDVVSNLVGKAGSDAPVADLEPDMRHFVRRCAPVALMISALDEQAPGAKVLIFGEDPQSIGEAADALGSRALLAPAAERLGPLQRAFLEILLMREASAIYACASQFSRLPAQVGRARLHEIGPDGDPGLWIRHFEAEILDRVSIQSERREELAALFLAFWREVADRAERIRQRPVRAPRTDVRPDRPERV